MSTIRKKLGYWKRGLVGFFQDKLERPPAFPAGLEFTTVGESSEGRKIGIARVGSGPVKIILVCGIHGNETGTVKLGRYLCWWLEENSKKFPDFSFYILPSLNLDGLHLAQKKRITWVADGLAGSMAAGLT